MEFHSCTETSECSGLRNVHVIPLKTHDALKKRGENNENNKGYVYECFRFFFKNLF